MTSPSPDRVVDALITRRLLTPAVRDDAIGVVGEALLAPASTPATPEPTARRSLPQLVEVVAYLGGALVLAAGGLFLAQAWGELDFAGRVIMLAVVGLVLGFAGVVAARVPSPAPSPVPGGGHRLDDPRRRLAGTLLTGAALTAALLVDLVLDEQLDTGLGEVYWPAVAAGAAGALVAAVGYRIAPTALGMLSMLGGIVTVVMNLVGALDRNEGLVSGIALFLVAVVWVALTELDRFRETMVARAAGVATGLSGAQLLVIEGTEPWLGYLLTGLVAVLGIWIYLARAAWPYLAGAVVAVTLVVPEMVADWTDGSVGAIGGVLVTGITLLLASFAGYQLRARTSD